MTIEWDEENGEWALHVEGVVIRHTSKQELEDVLDWLQSRPQLAEVE